MLFQRLVEVFEQLGQTSSGNRLRELLSAFFRRVPPREIEQVGYLTLGSIASAYEGVVFGMAEKMVLRSIAAASSLSGEAVQEAFKKLGDAGMVAAAHLRGRGGKLTIQEVFQRLHAIAAAHGQQSQERKISELAALMRRASPLEAKYLARIVLGTLRLGVADMTVLDSLAIAFTGDKKSKVQLEHAYNICPDVGIIAKALATKGLRSIGSIGVSVGRPVKMMLAQRAASIGEIMERMPEGIAAEEKYDGERVQIHRKGSRVTLFSRRMDTITGQFPELAAAAGQLKGEFIIEGEIVPLGAKGGLLPFQTLMQRRRKHDIAAYQKKIPVAVFLFDVLYVNGRSLLRTPYHERQEALRRLVGKETRVLRFARKTLSDEGDAIESFFNECVKRGTEGIIAKDPHGVYQAGRRGYLWIKWKREYAKELRDTFDLAVVGAFAGKGKRSGTYGALLCAAYNDKDDRFETVCKLGSGLTDEQLAGLPKRFKPYVIPHHAARLRVHKAMDADAWFEPALVVEVLGAELTRSPLHTCAEKDGTGLALRFPRLLRFRDDKKPEQATTTREIRGVYEKR